MNTRRILRAWVGVMLLLLGLALFPRGLSDSINRAADVQRGSVIGPAIGAVVGGVSLFFALILFLRVGREIWVEKKGVATRATITDAQKDLGGRWLVSYSYRDRQGVNHQGRLTTEQQVWMKGDVADVRYVETNPKESTLVYPSAGAARLRPANDEMFKDTTTGPQPTATATVEAPKPRAGSLLKAMALLVLAAAVVSVTIAGFMRVQELGDASIVRYGYWGAIEQYGTEKFIGGLLLVAAMLAVPVLFSLFILGILFGGLAALTANMMKK